MCVGCAAVGPAHSLPQPGWRERPGITHMRGIYYADDNGLTVATLAADLEQPLGDGAHATASALVDRLEIDPGERVSAGTQELDAVTGATVLASGDADRGRSESRVEASLGGGVERSVATLPTKVDATARFSTEPDYLSVSGRVGAAIELFARHTTIALHAGYGRDTISPAPEPRGQAELWPARADRVTGGATLSQVFGPTLVASTGFAVGRQWGTLSNPYRYAIVRDARLAERLPSERLRMTAFVGASWYVGFDTALHGRLGGYGDDWGVRAFVPEVELIHEVGLRGLVALRYVAYRQQPADFYAPSYARLEPDRTGDVRLGRVRGDQGFLDVSWTVLGNRDGFGSLGVSVGYGLSRFRYPVIEREVVAHLGTLGARVSY